MTTGHWTDSRKIFNVGRISECAKMDAIEMIKKLGEFLESSYKAELLKKVRKGEHFIEIDFSELMTSVLIV